MIDAAALVVAVDGPGGVGKSTVSRRVAVEIGVAHLDTGAFYRAATLAVLKAGAEPADEPAVVGLVARLDIDQSAGVTRLDGVDVSRQIRSEEVTDVVSIVSTYRAVRTRMVALQRRWVERHGNRAVVEGRDIGTVVFPGATVKVFLNADPEVRARRRSGETAAVPAEVAASLRKRDRLDSSRSVSPLVAAADAVVIDTTHLTIDEVVEQVLALIPNRG